jgi:hypothetical protein
VHMDLTPRLSAASGTTWILFSIVNQYARTEAYKPFIQAVC